MFFCKVSDLLKEGIVVGVDVVGQILEGVYLLHKELQGVEAGNGRIRRFGQSFG